MDITLQAGSASASADGTGDMIDGTFDGQVVINCVDAETGKPETVRVFLTPEQLATLGLSGNEISVDSGEVQLSSGSVILEHAVVAQEPVISLTEGNRGVSRVTLLSETETDPKAETEVCQESIVGQLVSAAKDVEKSTKDYIQGLETAKENRIVCGKGTVGNEVSTGNPSKETVEAAWDMFTCDTCDKSFQDSGELETHTRMHKEKDRLPIKEPTETDVKTLNCGICGKSFLSTKELEQHKSNTCKKCRRCYTTKNSYLFHKKSHAKEPVKPPDAGEGSDTKVDVMGYARRLMDRNPLDCIFCGKGLGNKLKLRIHRKKHFGETPFQCFFCDQSFILHSHLVAHIPTHAQNEDNPFLCLICGKRFASHFTMRIHKKLHDEAKGEETEGNKIAKPLKIPTGVNGITCLLCAEEFKDKIKAVNHAKTHAGEKPFMCGLCGTYFQMQSKLSRHIRRHAEEKLPKPVREKQPKKNPVDKSQTVEKVTPQSNNIKEKEYRCKYCEKSYTVYCSLSYHIRSVHSDKMAYKCQHCGKLFSSATSFEKHEQSHTREKTHSTTTSEKKHHCKRCGKSFTSSALLFVHNRIHREEKRLECEFCCKRFVSAGALEEHKRTHTGERPYICSDCGHTFTTSKYRYSHRRKHCKALKKRPAQQSFKCTVCEKILQSEKRLENHMRAHTGEKPFICEHCGEGFSYPVTLRNHVLTHNRDKLLSCDHCDKVFMLAANLKIHMRVHSGEKPYICEMCGKGFNLKMHLITHVNRHHGKPKSYKCEYCDKAFENEAGLNGHVCD